MVRIVLIIIQAGQRLRRGGDAALEPGRSGPALHLEVVVHRQRRMVAEPLVLVDAAAARMGRHARRGQVVVEPTKTLRLPIHAGNAVHTACGARQQMLLTADGGIRAYNLLEQLQFRATEALAGSRGNADRAVVLDQ